jgi:hypothetical protein
MPTLESRRLARVLLVVGLIRRPADPEPHSSATSIRGTKM